jgi:hypothetical protein
LRRSETVKSNSDGEQKVNTSDVLSGPAKVEEWHEIAPWHKVVFGCQSQ